MNVIVDKKWHVPQPIVGALTPEPEAIAAWLAQHCAGRTYVGHACNGEWLHIDTAGEGWSLPVNRRKGRK